MEFALSEDQVLLQDSVKSFLAGQAPLDTVRMIADGDEKAADHLRSGLAELGVAQILIPEDHGGLGLGLMEAALVQEALGYAVAPVDQLCDALAVIGLRHGASEEQQANWLPRIASGEARFGIALTERLGAREGAGVVSSPQGLEGKALFAMNTAQATHVMLADTEGSLHIVEAGASGFTQSALPTIDRTRSFAELKFHDVASENLPGAQSGPEADLAMILAGHVLLAADSLGAGQAMLDKAVDYAKERKQFNRVIGSFQAVKHMCAEMVAELEPARALVWHAAYALDTGDPEGPVMACLAKSHLAEVGTFVARTATEVHGGMGFTDLLGLHYWFKRIGANRQLLGSPETVRGMAARFQAWA